MTVDALRQAWPSVVEAIKAKGRVAAIVIGNASVASFDEGVLTLRFPRQGDVKGFQGSKYEDLLKQAITAMFGINVVVRAVTGGGDTPPAGRGPGRGPPRRPGCPPAASSRPRAGAVRPAVAGPAGTGPAAGQPRRRRPPGGTGPAAGRIHLAGPEAPGAEGRRPQRRRPPLPAAAVTGDGGGHEPVRRGSRLTAVRATCRRCRRLRRTGRRGFRPETTTTSSSTTVNELTGMALVHGSSARRSSPSTRTRTAKASVVRSRLPVWDLAALTCSRFSLPRSRR